MGSTLYTTMEPCSKRLSGNLDCTTRCLSAGVSRVVVGVGEPSKFVECEGTRILKENGIEVSYIQDETLSDLCLGASNKDVLDEAELNAKDPISDAELAPWGRAWLVETLIADSSTHRSALVVLTDVIIGDRETFVVDDEVAGAIQTLCETPSEASARAVYALFERNLLSDATKAIWRARVIDWLSTETDAAALVASRRLLSALLSPSQADSLISSPNVHVQVILACVASDPSRLLSSVVNNLIVPPIWLLAEFAHLLDVNDLVALLLDSAPPQKKANGINDDRASAAAGVELLKRFSRASDVERDVPDLIQEILTRTPTAAGRRFLDRLDWSDCSDVLKAHVREELGSASGLDASHALHETSYSVVWKAVADVDAELVRFEELLTKAWNEGSQDDSRMEWLLEHISQGLALASDEFALSFDTARCLVGLTSDDNKSHVVKARAVRLLTAVLSVDDHRTLCGTLFQANSSSSTGDDTLTDFDRALVEGWLRPSASSLGKNSRGGYQTYVLEMTSDVVLGAAVVLETPIGACVRDRLASIFLNSDVVVCPNVVSGGLVALLRRIVAAYLEKKDCSTLASAGCVAKCLAALREPRTCMTREPVPTAARPTMMRLPSTGVLQDNLPPDALSSPVVDEFESFVVSTLGDFPSVALMMLALVPPVRGIARFSAGRLQRRGGRGSVLRGESAPSRTKLHRRSLALPRSRSSLGCRPPSPLDLRVAQRPQRTRGSLGGSQKRIRSSRGANELVRRRSLPLGDRPRSSPRCGGRRASDRRALYAHYRRPSFDSSNLHPRHDDGRRAIGDPQNARHDRGGRLERVPSHLLSSPRMRRGGGGDSFGGPCGGRDGEPGGASTGGSADRARRRLKRGISESNVSLSFRGVRRFSQDDWINTSKIKQ